MKKLITKVKMKVTPELSEQVQKIVFNHGGSWCGFPGLKEVQYTEKKYLFINWDKRIAAGDSSNDDIKINIEQEDNEKYVEVSAKAFIAGNGEKIINKRRKK